MQHFNIRPAIEQDFPPILELVKGLAAFQKTPEKVFNTVEQMKAEQEYFECFIAENEAKEIVGIAVYSFVYSTWVGKSIYLDDLYVLETYRGHKIGSQLLKALFEVAQKENCKRVRWLVSHWNTPALKFYQKIGAKIYKEEWICDFDREAILNFNV
ncbi:MAG: N-acetyltransferase family protein [Chitinophagales bacterium]